MHTGSLNYLNSQPKEALRPVRIAVVGIGRWGAKLARCLESLPGCELLVLCDIDRSRIATTHFGVSVRISDSFEAVLTDEAIDAVVIATPAPLHAEQTVRALGSGKHVFVEKPMALSSRHAREITAATASSSRIVMVGHILQHDPTMHQLKKLCASGALGSLQYIEAERFNTTLPGPSEGVWWNLGPHDVSTILQLAGEMPLKVSGSPLRLPGCAGEAYAAQLEFSSGLKADIRVADGYLTKVRRLRVVGSEGSVLWAPLNSNRLQLVPLRGARTEFECPPIASGRDALTLELADFVSAIRERRAPRTDHHQGGQVVSVLESALPGIIVQSLRHISD